MPGNTFSPRSPRQPSKSTLSGLQANLWNQSLVLDPEIPEPSDWGWVKESTGWQPFWTAATVRKGALDGARVSKLHLHVQISVFVREPGLGLLN